MAALFLGAGPASAQAGLVGRELTTCVRAVADGDTVRSVLGDTRGFDCTSDQRRFGPGDFWIITPPLVGTTTTAPFRLRQTSTWFGGMALYALHADGSIRTVEHDPASVSRHIRLGAIIEHEIPVGVAPVVRLLWRIDGSPNLRGLVLGARLASVAQSERSDMVLAAMYGGFAGLCIALIAYNLALWQALRYKFQLVHCAMLSCLLLYAVTSSGALAWAFPTIPNPLRITLNYTLLAWATAAALAFSRRFFEERVFEGWLGRAVMASTIGFVILGTTFLLLAPAFIRLLDLVYAVMFAVIPLIVLPILWRAWRRRSNYLWFFALTWASPMAMVTTRAFHNLGLIPWSFWLDNSTLLAMSAEALLTSLAIAYRFRLLRAERDEAVRLEAISRELADTDPLTGLLNRRAFLAQAIGLPGARTLMLLDIDHFKQVNETIGHDGGDDVLRIFARTLRQQVPPDVLVARMGGEEFALVGLPHALPDPDQLLATVRTQRMPFDLRVTTSIGVCHGPLVTERDWKRLYRHADQALFQAKASGRDQVARGIVLANAA